VWIDKTWLDLEIGVFSQLYAFTLIFCSSNLNQTGLRSSFGCFNYFAFMHCKELNDSFVFSFHCPCIN
jgi:hypothetical protein